MFLKVKVLWNSNFKLLNIRLVTCTHMASHMCGGVRTSPTVQLHNTLLQCKFEGAFKVQAVEVVLTLQRCAALL
jgi:hypothetical protein